MLYQEYQPRDELKPYVKCYWVVEDPLFTSTEPQRIVPDGRMELVFHFGHHFEDVGSVHPRTQARSIVVGQIRKAMVIRPTGPSGMFGVRFLPFGFSSLYLNPANELTECEYSCEEVMGKMGAELEDRVLSARSHQERAQIIESHLMDQLKNRGDYDFRIHRIVRKLYQTGGVFKSEEIASQFNISSRQLERLFQSRVGVTPNSFGRIVRFQKAISMKLCDLTLTTAEIAHAVGYYDQSHFIKDFKEFSGLSPKRYFAETHQMADFFTAES